MSGVSRPPKEGRRWSQRQSGLLVVVWLRRPVSASLRLRSGRLVSSPWSEEVLGTESPQVLQRTQDDEHRICVRIVASACTHEHMQDTVRSLKQGGAKTKGLYWEKR